MADPWLPLDLRRGEEGVKAFTATATSLDYATLSEVLFDASKFRLPLLARPDPAERRQPATLVAQVLVRGQGKTDGFHRREVRLPSTVLSRVAAKDQLLAARARSFVDLAGTVHGKALRLALLQYVDGSEEPDWRNPQHATLIGPFLRKAAMRADREFFTVLTQSFEEELADDAAALTWGRVLAGHAEEVLEHALGSLPTRCDALVMAEARARSRLQGALSRHVPGLRKAARTPMGDSA